MEYPRKESLMNERITLVSLLDTQNTKKINNLVNQIKEPLCKVPFGKNVTNREQNDTLPFHFTLFSWSIKKKEEILQFLNSIKVPSLKVEIDKIEIMTGNEDSYILYFHMKPSNELKALQTTIYNAYPYEYYNPDTFEFHITIDIDKDYDKIKKRKKAIEKNFTPFELEVKTFGLFEIYPAKLIATISP